MNPKNKPPNLGELRRRAEDHLGKKPTIRAENDVTRLLHELQVHQVELEMQNRQLLDTQAQLEESLQRYTDLFDFAPVGYLTLSTEGLIEEINITGANLLGNDRSLLCFSHFDHAVARADSVFWRSFFKAVLFDEVGKRRSTELGLLRKDESVFPAQLECTRIVNEASETKVRMAFTDVSLRKQAEDELRVAAIAFEAQEGMMVTDANGVIVRVNQAFTQLTGYSAAEALGHKPAMLKSDRHDADFYKSMWDTIKAKKYWQGEVWNKRKDGEIFAEWLTISSVCNKDGETTHYVGTFSDITTKMEAEEKLIKSNAELEQFAFIASHDLREPLRMVKLYIVLIARRMAEHFDDDTREFMGYVLEGAGRMENLVNDLLEYSRTGRSSDSPTRVDFAEIIKNTTNYLQESLEKCHGVVEWTGKFPEIIGNESELVRLFQNMIGNAIKYRSPERALKIDVKMTSSEDDWLFSITDNGIGIESEYFERIFRIFQRLHAPGACGGGTGIGLAICKKIVEDYGGKIWLESEVDVGSTFFFTIPKRNQAIQNLAAKPL
jgi:PAS domain S-box-containing protein